jgi:hypothetical protein
MELIFNTVGVPVFDKMFNGAQDAKKVKKYLV